MSQDKLNNSPLQPTDDAPPDRQSGSAQPPGKEEQSASMHHKPTRPMPPVDADIEEPLPDLDDGPRPGPVDEIQAALFEASRSGLSTEIGFNDLADPLLEIDEVPPPSQIDEVQEALLNAAQAGMNPEIDLDALPEPIPIVKTAINFKPKLQPVSTPQSPEAPQLDEAPQPDDIPTVEVPLPVEDLVPDEELPPAEAAQPEAFYPSEESTYFEPFPDATEEPVVTSHPAPALQAAPASDPQSASTDVWYLLALFVTFRFLSLFLLRPGGFIRDWSDFDTYFGIASLSDYALFPFLDFWLEWPPLVPWLAVGAYKVALLLPPWADDPRLWFILILGSIFFLFEIGNFMLIYRLAQRLFQSSTVINRVLWLYAGLFAPIYTMLGFFDGVALFFILLALYLLLSDQRFPSAISVGVGFMVKIIPGLMLPVAARRLWYQYRENSRDIGIEAGLYTVAFGLTAIILLMPFLIVGPQWVVAAARSMLGRASWETIWAIIDGYYGFGVVLGDRLNPLETSFAVHEGSLSEIWWVITLVFAGIYAFIFTRPADYNRPRNLVAFTGLTFAIFMLYSKGYSPQFLIYLLPFILLLMPDGRGLTYALILTGLNVLEQPVYFVLMPNERWLLAFVVVARFIVIAAVAIEFALVLWPAEDEKSVLAQTHGYMPPVLGSLAIISLVVLTPLMLRSYASNQLVDSPVGIFAGFIKSQVRTESTKPRFLLSDQATYRQLYPQLRSAFDLQLSDGPSKQLSSAASVGDLLEGLDHVWILPTGPQQALLTDAVAGRGTMLASYTFEEFGTASLYSFNPNAIPKLPVARFIGGIELVGHQTELKSEVVEITLYWRASTPQNQNLTVFTHMINEAGELVASHDSVPRHGLSPVTDWTTNVIQTDLHRIQLPANFSPGQYSILAGLYNDSTERVRSINPEGVEYMGRAVPLGVVQIQ